jgi:glutathione S-transferase
MPPITLYFLGASRSIRIAWLLEELGLDYEIKGSERENQKAPRWMKDEVGGLGKFPVLTDGNEMITESGNIVECEASHGQWFPQMPC